MFLISAIKILYFKVYYMGCQPPKHKAAVSQDTYLCFCDSFFQTSCQCSKESSVTALTTSCSLWFCTQYVRIMGMVSVCVYVCALCQKWMSSHSRKQPKRYKKVIKKRLGSTATVWLLHFNADEIINHFKSDTLQVWFLYPIGLSVHPSMLNCQWIVFKEQTFNTTQITI